MAGLGGILGAGDAVRQLFLWQIAAQVIGAAGGPYFEQLAAELNTEHPTTPLTPPQAADNVVRNFTSHADGAAEAAKSGIDAGRFAQMVHAAGDAPAPGQLAEALRRALIERHGTGPDSTSFAQGIAEGRLADKWTAMMEGLAQIWPTPTDALDALLKGQLDHGAAVEAYRRLGGDPQWFDMLLHTQGEGPSPREAAEAARRGIIAWGGAGPGVTSFHQAVLESRFRDKWEDTYRALAEYLPPPRTITAMLKEGALSAGQAAQLLTEAGLPPDLVAAYLHAAHTTKVAKAKELTAAEVIRLYEGRILGAADVTALLESFGYTEHEVQLELDLAEVRREITELSAAVSRLRSLFVGHKISRQAAAEALAALEIPAAEAQRIVAVWVLERGANVRPLTAGEITDAWEYSIITEDEALAMLEQLGYTPRDAWVRLSIKAKAPLGGKPPPGPAALTPG